MGRLVSAPKSVCAGLALASSPFNAAPEPSPRFMVAGSVRVQPVLRFAETTRPLHPTMIHLFRTPVRGLLPLLLLGLIAGLTVPARAQTGTIAGLVVDGETGETLIGVNVIIEGTTIGAATDLDGAFTIAEVAPGTYTLQASYIGYHPVTITGVAVRAGETTRLEIAMTSEAVEVGEVVVEARLVQNTEAALLNQRQKAAAVKDAISAEAMSQAGSGNAAEAMTKVTGASVVGGKYVYVRGLGGRYSTAQLNGTSMPSADPDQNAAQFDLFPTNLLDNIVATKTFTPDQPGSFSGGSVNVNTKTFPDGFTLKASASSAFNTVVSRSDRFMTGPASGTDWLGFDDGLREIPAPLRDPDVVIPRPTQARRNPELAAQLDAFSRSFNSVMVPRMGTAGLNQSYALSAGNRVSFLGRPLGFVASGTYSQGYSGYDDGRTAQYAAVDPGADSLNADFVFTDLSGTRSANWGLLGTLAYQPHPYHEVSLNVLRTQDGEALGRYQYGPYPKNFAPTVTYETYVLQYTERRVQSYQARGEHALPALAGLRIDWNAARTGTTQQEPDLRFFFDQYVTVTRADSSFRVYNINLGSSNATPPTRLWRDLQEENTEGNLNLTIPMRRGARSGQIKVGGSYLYKDRTFRERKFDYEDNALEFAQFFGDIDAYFAPENVGIIDSTSGRYIFGNTIREGTRPANNYDGTQEVAAAYGMIEWPLLRTLRLVGGVRYETTNMEIVSRDSTKAPGRIEEGDVLPSVNLIYALAPNANLRLSATRTLARPTFREIAPFTSFSFAGGPELSGNPELERTLITNYDLRWEWFMRPGEVLAVSGFYKYFQQPIERVFVSNNNQVTYVNVPAATVYGVEFEARKALDGLVPALRDLVFYTNLALIASEVDVPERELEFAEGFDIAPTRPFQGQSPYVINVGLTYDNPRTGTAASLSYNRFGERLTAVTLGGAPNIFEQPRNDLYLSVSQRLFDAFELRLSVDNLLGADFVEQQEYKGTAFETRRYEYGRSFKLSLSYEL